MKPLALADLSLFLDEPPVIRGPCLRQIHPGSVSFEALDKEEKKDCLRIANSSKHREGTKNTSWKGKLTKRSRGRAQEYP
ncbi:unnamed protein product [Prunus armeniaca]|uniref:Uncharacterized protein n=1 Tax=Prunus armeniaca TaxID=36596 RepID=A0A6J5VD57_PRUAR|nr:unnamed protein product [Prunus armeniaca]